MSKRAAAIRCAGGVLSQGQADHPVELRALDRDLDVVDDEVARGEDVAAGRAGAGDEVARRGGADLERQPAGGADRLLHDLGDAVEVAEADRQLRRAVDDGDLRLLDVLVGEPERLPLRPSRRLAHAARLEVAAQRSTHESSALAATGAAVPWRKTFWRRSSSWIRVRPRRAPRTPSDTASAAATAGRLAGQPALRDLAHERLRRRVAGDVPAGGEHAVELDGDERAVRHRNGRELRPRRGETPISSSWRRRPSSRRAVILRTPARRRVWRIPICGAVVISQAFSKPGACARKQRRCADHAPPRLELDRGQVVDFDAAVAGQARAQEERDVVAPRRRSAARRSPIARGASAISSRYSLRSLHARTRTSAPCRRPPTSTRCSCSG